MCEIKKESQGKTEKSLLKFESMINIIKTFRKYLVCLLNTNSFEKKYTTGVKCYLHLRSKLDMFEKSR